MSTTVWTRSGLIAAITALVRWFEIGPRIGSHQRRRCKNQSILQRCDKGHLLPGYLDQRWPRCLALSIRGAVL